MAGAQPKILKNTQEFVIPQDPRLAKLVPVRNISLHGVSSIAIPHTVESTRLARNFGYPVPAPILSQYSWPTDPTPFETQKITAALLTMNRRAYVLSEMGTGKTRAVLYACDYMMHCGFIKKVLVCAPLSTLVQVWDKEIFRYFMHRSTVVLHAPNRKKRLLRLQKHSDADFHIINHNGLENITAELVAQDYDVVVIDEGSVFRNPSTKLWAAAKEVLRTRPYAWLLTGSPAPNEPPDAWGQAKLLTPATATAYKGTFKRRTMTKVSMFRWVAKADANDHVYAMLQPAVRFQRDDCVELPETTYKTIDVPLSRQVKDVYSKMMAQLSLRFQQGSVTAANEGVLYTKLLQISCGWVYTSDKQIVSLDNKPRVRELLDIFSQSAGKVICFVGYRHAAEQLYTQLRSTISCALVHGGIQGQQRNVIFNVFQDGEDKQLLIAHPQCMAHGLTLTAANTIVWFTPVTSLEIYEQANARITRPGQKAKTLIIHLTGSSIDRKIYSRLRHRSKLQGALLELFTSDINK